MLLAILLTLSAGQPADWQIFDPNVAAGTVPRLLAPPGDLPLPQAAAGGVFLPSPLDGYVASQVTALGLYPDLAQLALDQAVAARGRQCEIETLEAADRARAESCGSCFWSSARAGMVGLAIGLLIGVAVAVR